MSDRVVSNSGISVENMYEMGIRVAETGKPPIVIPPGLFDEVLDMLLRCSQERDLATGAWVPVPVSLRG